MTTPQPLSAADRAQTFLDWTKINSRALTTGAAIIVLAAGAYWFWSRSKGIQATNAEAALTRAKTSLAAGNAPLAETDLKSLISRYGSTPAGVEAAMLLAQTNYESGKYQDGIAQLEKVADKSAAARNKSAILSLEGDGYAQLGKFTEAGKAYEDAADATMMETDKSFQLAKAARVYQAAGDTAKARQLWTGLLDSDPTVAEARVRLGELSAQTANR